MKKSNWRSCLTLALLFIGSSTLLAAENWNQWRGPLGTGHTTETLPVKFDQSNVVWKLDLPGVGQSSPTTWGNKIFLTSALEDGNQRMVFCVNADTGKIVWKKVAWTGKAEKTHAMNNRASSSCVTDGENVIAFFGKGGIHSYTVDGKHNWSRELGEFAGPWGTASSPIIVDDIIVQNCDADDTSYLLGLDLKTGKTVWKTERFVVRGWSTPLLVDTGKRKELVMNGHNGINAYDPKTGKDLWFCKGDNGRGTPTVVPYKKTIIAVAGRPGDMVSVKSGGSGDVTSTHEVWRTKRTGSRDLPSPTIVGDRLFVASLPGLATLYNAATGEELDKQRLDGGFSASPLVAGGLIYLPSESGEILVIETSQPFKIIARNNIGNSDEEIFRASITPYQGKLLCRSDTVLYCVGK
ncbi:MAG: hypothetical protein COA78_37980 [Blastopirellula sp.]|nr:MAG: hypothetical protein COA78_37980 [Blastopirellula sp.]